MKNYLGIIKNSKLQTNLTVTTWFPAIFRAPFYETYSRINDGKFGTSYSLTEEYNLEANSHLYVQHYELLNFYELMLYNKDKEIFNYEVFLALFYFALACSLIVFVFRISSLLNWFLAVVVFIIFNIINVIVSESFSNYDLLKYISFIYCIVGEVIICSLLAFILKRNRRISKLAANVFVLGFAFVIPGLAFLIFNLNHNFYGEV